MGAEMTGTGIAWLSESTLQIRVSIPIRLSRSEVDQTFPLASKMNFSLAEGALTLDSEGGVYHACVATRRSESGPSEKEVNYCLDHAAAMATCFGEILLHDELWRIATNEIDQHKPDLPPTSWN